MTSSLDKGLVSLPCTATGSRSLAAHLCCDHVEAVYTSPYEDHAAHSAMHATAHKVGRCVSLPAHDTAARPVPPSRPGEGTAGVFARRLRASGARANESDPR